MEPKYIGIDLHKEFFQACAVDGQGTRMWEGRFPRTDGGLTLFQSHCSPTTAVAVEASGPTWAFVDALMPSGARICVVDPRKTKLKAGYAAKTDRLDARRLADALRRDSVVSVYVPPPAIRELREVCRGRHQVIRIRTRVAQMIRALLLRSGVADVPVRRVFSPRGLAWLETVVLPPDAHASLTRLRHMLGAVHAEALDAEARLTARAKADPMACALDTLVGIGPVLGLTIRAEIGDITRFRRGAELASYAGLVPRVDASADRYWSGRITREGAPWLRWALVEAAMHARHRHDALGRWARQLAIRKGVFKARVAFARRLCDDIVQVWPRQMA
ncbi:MAG TPA: IS110 family transposase [Vicinamibacterales bacterium]